MTYFINFNQVFVQSFRNKLSLNLGKTESILFGSCKKICNSPSSDIKCGDTKISPKKSVRYLGGDLEQTLSGKLIMENILKKEIPV